ncbi:MAG: hypothetical protein QXW00_01870 [Candidatus Woesearchaeota archaeon]
MKDRVHRADKDSKVKAVLLALAVFTCFFSAYVPHLKNPFPIHVDEWQHLAQIIAISEGKPNLNPYVGERHFDFEILFHLIWAFPALLMGRVGFILFSRFIPAILAALSGFCLYFSLRKMKFSYIEALLSIFIFATLKSGLNLLGTAYFVPMSAAFPLMFLFLGYFSESVAEGKNILISTLLWVLLFMIYPPSATILLPAIITYPLFFPNFIKKRAKLLLVFGIILTCMIITSLLIRLNGEVAFFLILKNLVFKFGWGGYELKYSIPLLFTIPGFILALMGAYLKKGEDRPRLLLLAAFFSILISFIFQIFNVSFLAPYQRVVYYVMIFMVPLAGVGLSKVYLFLYSRVGSTFAVIAVVLILGLMFQLKYPSKSLSIDYAKPIMNMDAWNALLWARDNLPNDSVILSDFMLSSAVTPIAGRVVQAVLPAQLGTFDRQEERLVDAIKFFNNGECSEKLGIIDKWNVSVVISDKRETCLEFEGFQLAYAKNYFIYRKY